MISIRRLMKYRGWKVLQIHDMHVCLLAIFYILIVDNLFAPVDSLILISSLGFYFMYGFLINDFFDQSYDITAGKKRAVQELPKIIFVGIIISVVFISALHLLYLKKSSYIVIYVFSYILATLYSIPMIRFKEKGLVGIIINALIEKMLPVLAIFVFFNHFGMDTFVFLITSFLLQVVDITTHQIHDYENDIKTGIRTFVVDIGIDKALKIFRSLVLPFSLLFIIFLSFLIIIKVPYAIFIVAIVLTIYLLIFLLITKGKLNKEEKVLPFYMFPLYSLINYAFPLFLAFLLSIAFTSNIILLLVVLGSQYDLLMRLLALIKEKVVPRIEIADT